MCTVINAFSDLVIICVFCFILYYCERGGADLMILKPNP